MSPLNPPSDVDYATRLLMNDAVAAIDHSVRTVLTEHRRREDDARAATDADYRAWHSRYGRFVVLSEKDPPEMRSFHATEAAARRQYGIPHLTETPVDRWMDRVRRTH